MYHIINYFLSREIYYDHLEALRELNYFSWQLSGTSTGISKHRRKTKFRATKKYADGRNKKR